MILFGYIDNQGILLVDGESRYESWGSSIWGGLVFQLVCRFHRYWAYSSKSTVQPKMESCFQDGACSVCFLLQIVQAFGVLYQYSLLSVASATPICWAGLGEPSEECHEGVLMASAAKSLLVLQPRMSRTCLSL